MSSGSAVKVAIRTRPTASFAQEHIIVGEDRHQLTVRLPKGDNPNAQDSWSWRFDAVLHNSSQETVYTEQVAPIVHSVLQGYNGTVMCYGQTGAGKTFTQIGSLESYQNRGITPRAVADIFSYMNEHPQFESTVAVSFVEIYQDTLVDLLSTLPTADPVTEALALVEDKNGATHVKNLRQQVVGTEEEALAMLFEGQTNRQVANHQLNRNSTRGHAIFTIHIRIRSRVDSSGVVTKCKLNLVDLAGSERLKKTATDGDLRSESMYINRSLTFLEQVVVALSSKGRSHTPYRQSKLTHLLKDSLGGNCKTLLIANVYGESSHLEETISTLQFAARVRLVPNEASLNQVHDPEQLLKKYAMEISDLKRELSMHNSLASRSRIAYEPYSDQQRIALMSELQEYLTAAEGSTSEIDLQSVRQMRELLAAMKNLYGKQQGELDRMSKIIATGGPFPGGEGGADASVSAPNGEVAVGGEQGIGDEVSGSRGMAIGVAPDGAKPSGGLVEPPAYQRGVGEEGAEAPLNPELTGSGAGLIEVGTMGRDEAYVQYKLAEGAETNMALAQAKKDLKEARATRIDAAGRVNDAKRHIDRAKVALDAKTAEREAQASNRRVDETDIIDEEEFSMIQELKKLKKIYKTEHTRMLTASQIISQSSSSVDHLREQLLSGFNTWYSESFYDGDAAAAPAPIPVKSPSPENRDVMDDDEQFEQLQMQRVMAEEPESLAFVRARQSVSKKAGPRKK